MMLRLSRLQARDSIVDASGRPTSFFQTFWQRVVSAIEEAFSSITSVNDRQEDLIEQLASAVAAIQAAQAAADAAAQAATQAAAEAVAAQQAAETAQASAGDANDYAFRLEERIAALEEAQP